MPDVTFFVVLPPDIVFRVPLGMVANFEFVLHLQESKKSLQNNAVFSTAAHDGTGNGLHSFSVLCNGEFGMLSNAGPRLVRPIR
jgi:hypothetical protein